MKLAPCHRKFVRDGRTVMRSGFTLLEVMVSMGIFSMAMMAMVYAHLFGLRQDQLVQSKLGASEESRRSFNALCNDIRSAKMWQIGEVASGQFTPLAEGAQQRGNAIRLHRTMNTNAFVLYFFDSSAGELRRKVGGQNGSDLIASHLVNTREFRAETPSGTIQTDLSHKGVIHCQFEFAQYQYPLTRVGPGYYYDYYRMTFKVTPHVPDGP